MSWWKDRIIEQETERLQELWEDNFLSLQARYPDFDDLPLWASDLPKDIQDECYSEIERRIMEDFAGHADNLRKRQREEG